MQAAFQRPLPFTIDLHPALYLCNKAPAGKGHQWQVKLVPQQARKQLGRLQEEQGRCAKP